MELGASGALGPRGPQGLGASGSQSTRSLLFLPPEDEPFLSFSRHRGHQYKCHIISLTGTQLAGGGCGDVAAAGKKYCLLSVRHCCKKKGKNPNNL